MDKSCACNEDAWRIVWRQGFAPLIPTGALVSLADALAKNVPELSQRSTTVPLPVAANLREPCLGGCAVSFCGWVAFHLPTVQDVERYFAELCRRCDDRMGYWRASSYFLNWFDDGAREDVFRRLHAEVRRELARRDERSAAGLDPELAVYDPVSPLAESSVP